MGGRQAGSTDGNRSHATLALEQVRHHPPAVAVDPAPSLFTLAADLAGARRGSPAEWVTAARAELEPADLTVLAPIGAPPDKFTPGCLIAARGGGSDSAAIQVELERIATLPVEALLDDIAFAHGESPLPPWDAVVRRPRWWLVHYARALARVWRSLSDVWADASALFDRELERVHIALERGAEAELLAGLHHRAQVRDGIWRLDHAEPVAFSLGGGLPIIPVLSGPGSARVHYADNGRLIGILYPLPGAGRLLDDELLAPPAALEALLGPRRAAILRYLDRPRTAGRVAEVMSATPSAVTHHLRALEAAGLVVRERSGRRVIVHRSARGSALVGLYGD